MAGSFACLQCRAWTGGYQCARVHICRRLSPRRAKTRQNRTKQGSWVVIVIVIVRVRAVDGPQAMGNKQEQFEDKMLRRTKSGSRSQRSGERKRRSRDMACVPPVNGPANVPPSSPSMSPGTGRHWWGLQRLGCPGLPVNELAEGSSPVHPSPTSHFAD
ncbi:uncharacterized protein F5Z01DRAFT_327645 [Emericellopsis atlantica]|uniref:Uncharacterized protein n=1 Tax=Emericellopsis atlantica TaxID=2614577 RepID=A0A9P7ZTW6_9HYPO|nr:uncharacterized protein F5Z01DRAFT_327645 [Emericellopsis atlantica]KAG9258278.1 hypothetical protein F5Z01DRAFT_327645 [Emericellopsis atlantica]